VSEQKSLLTAAAETLQLLFYPFQWPHVYIPVLSRWLLDFIQAPTPFIMGVPAQLLPYMPEVCEVIMVDLDKGTVQSDEPLVRQCVAHTHTLSLSLSILLVSLVAFAHSHNFPKQQASVYSIPSPRHWPTGHARAVARLVPIASTMSSTRTRRDSWSFVVHSLRSSSSCSAAIKSTSRSCAAIRHQCPSLTRPPS